MEPCGKRTARWSRYGQEMRAKSTDILLCEVAAHHVDANEHASGVCICKRYIYIILSTRGIRGLKGKSLKVYRYDNYEIVRHSRRAQLRFEGGERDM